MTAGRSHRGIRHLVLIAVADRDAAARGRQETAREKGTYWVPSVGGSVLPAINASSEAAAVELEETLLTHHIGRVEKGLLIEVRKRLLQTLHAETPPALAQHLCNRGLNRAQVCPPP